MNAIVNFKGLTGDAMDSKKDFLDHTDEASLHLDGAASLLTILQSAIEGEVVSSERAAKLIDGVLTLIDHSYEALCSEKTGNWSTVMDLIESAEAGLDCLKKGVLQQMDAPSKKIQVAAVHALGYLVDEAKRFLEMLVKDYVKVA